MENNIFDYTEYFCFSTEENKVSVFERDTGIGEFIVAYNVMSGSVDESMERFCDMCSEHAVIGLDYADFLSVVMGHPKGVYYRLDNEGQFKNVLAQRDEDTKSILILLDGNVSLASIVPYQDMLDKIGVDVLIQIVPDAKHGDGTKFHVWLFG